MKLKVCGMRQERNIAAVLGLKPDYLGFVLVPESARYVSKHPSKVLLQECRGDAKFVGVFSDAEPDEIARQAEALTLDVIQLHGSESSNYCVRLKALLPRLKIWKALAVSGADSLGKASHYDDCVDAILLDSSLKGGSGKQFDWSLLHSYKSSKETIISGGIEPEDGKRVSELGKRFSWISAVDINSRFETTPGIKDLTKISAFLEQLRS